MKLTELHPEWMGAGGAGISDKDGNPVPERHGVGVLLDCPCGCDRQLYVPFANPLDGGPPVNDGHASWQRSGDTFGDAHAGAEHSAIEREGWLRLARLHHEW